MNKNEAVKVYDIYGLFLKGELERAKIGIRQNGTAFGFVTNNGEKKPVKVIVSERNLEDENRVVEIILREPGSRMGIILEKKLYDEGLPGDQIPGSYEMEVRERLKYRVRVKKIK